MNQKNIITLNDNQEIIVVHPSGYEHLGKLLKKYITEDDIDAMYWFKYLFYYDPCGAKLIYTNRFFRDTANL